MSDGGFSHDKVARHLARWLRGRAQPRVTWENMAIDGGGGARPDVFSILPKLDVRRCQPFTHEVKVSRADMLADLRGEKWRCYYEFSSRIFFAAPEGIIKPLDLPLAVGLYVLNVEKKTWRMVKPAKLHSDWQLTTPRLMKLILGRWGSVPEEQEPTPAPVVYRHTNHGGRPAMPSEDEQLDMLGSPLAPSPDAG